MTPVRTVGFERLGLKVLDLPPDNRRVEAAMQTIRAYIEDRNPMVVFLEDEEGYWYALVAHKGDGHGDYDIFEI